MKKKKMWDNLGSSHSKHNWHYLRLYSSEFDNIIKGTGGLQIVSSLILAFEKNVKFG